MMSGSYKIEWNSGDFPSGIYFLIIRTKSFSETDKNVINEVKITPVSIMVIWPAAVIYCHYDCVPSLSLAAVIYCH